MIQLHHGDCREVIPTLGVTVDAVVTDPPYHLTSVARGQTPGSVAASNDVFRRVIEQEAGYVADIRERLAFYEGGGTHSVQAKNRSRKIDHGPLFADPGAVT